MSAVRARSPSISQITRANIKSTPHRFCNIRYILSCPLTLKKTASYVMPGSIVLSAATVEGDISMKNQAFKFAIDRGGTFTDVFCEVLVHIYGEVE
jgi:hypothetical protein